MSCFVVGKSEYIKFANTLLAIVEKYNVSDEMKNIIKSYTCNLYELNQRAYNYRYNINQNNIDHINIENFEPKMEYNEDSTQTFYRIYFFLRCIAYQINENKIYNKLAMPMIYELTWYAGRKLLKHDENIKWGIF